MFSGLSAFVISLTTYLLTLEPTASLWDCSEFIASSYKLQVPHSPGTPLSLLVGRLFTWLAFGDTSKVAWSINVMSAFFSALTVYTIYYIIYFFGERMMTDVMSGTRRSSSRWHLFVEVCASRFRIRSGSRRSKRKRMALPAFSLC